ncbi:MAG: SUMF1/EgtB/PvdO family nonheme iron enzyme [Chloroflexi bacterium]|nr:SUMF1/EgtB/PvdO family nonheme iron enzyme [Chloroflexota bacterium]
MLLTILALIKYTGVSLPERRVELYELYLKTLIESWNQARALDKQPVGPFLPYGENVRILAPLALRLRQENPQAGLIGRSQLEQWLAEHFHGPEWGLPLGEARQRADQFLASIEKYTNLLLERGERQYGFLHLTLEEMLAAEGLALLADADWAAALASMRRYLLDPAWRETLLLAVGAVALLRRNPKTAGDILLYWLETPVAPETTGQPALLAGEALLDVGRHSVVRPAGQTVLAAPVAPTQSAACPTRARREAGSLLGRLGWRPDPEPGDLLLATAGDGPTGLDAFRPVEISRPDRSARPVRSNIWLGKYPVTNIQFARFITDGGYERREFWSDDGWAWRTGIYDSKAPDYLQDWLKDRPSDRRSQPFWWTGSKWNNPIFPVVGVSWFEAEAYGRWLTEQLTAGGQLLALQKQLAGSGPSPISNLSLAVRLPSEAEWAAAMSGQGDYPWGNTFDPVCLNCAEGWFGREFKDDQEWQDWVGSEAESWREAGTTAVTTYPQGASPNGLWDGSGNVWEWTAQVDKDGRVPLRGGSWLGIRRIARVSSRYVNHPDAFYYLIGFRCVVAPDFS